MVACQVAVAPPKRENVPEQLQGELRAGRDVRAGFPREELRERTRRWRRGAALLTKDSEDKERRTGLAQKVLPCTASRADVVKHLDHLVGHVDQPLALTKYHPRPDEAPFRSRRYL